jgi:hypothetical protein
VLQKLVRVHADAAARQRKAAPHLVRTSMRALISASNLAKISWHYANASCHASSTRPALMVVFRRIFQPSILFLQLADLLVEAGP